MIGSRPGYLVVLAGVLAVTVLAGCSQDAPATPASADPSPTATAVPTATPPPTPVPTPVPTATPSPLVAYESGRRLQTADPALATTIEQLAWVQDGVDDDESLAFEAILDIGVDHRPVASAIVAMPWLQDDVTEDEGWVTVSIAAIADVDADLAMTVVRLGWIREELSDSESVFLVSAAILANVDADAAGTLFGFPWVRDGISDTESLQALGLWALAGVDHLNGTSLASRAISFSWVADGIDASEGAALDGVLVSAVFDAEIATALLSLPWVADDINDLEADSLGALGIIAESDGGGIAFAVLDLEWMQNGIDVTDRDALNALATMSETDPELARSVLTLWWMQSTVSVREAAALTEIGLLADADGAVAQTVVAFPWVQDGISEKDVDALVEIGLLSKIDVAFAATVVALPWVQDNLSERETDALAELRALPQIDVAFAATVVALPWVQDGLSEHEADALRQIKRVAQVDVDVAESLMPGEWLRDGINRHEKAAIDDLRELAGWDPGLASDILAGGWVQREMTTTHAQTIEFMLDISYSDEDIARELFAMPFMETIEPADASALQSLYWLAALEPTVLNTVLAHPALRDGITDEWTPIIATLEGVQDYNPDLVDVLLESPAVRVERRDIQLPYSGTVELAIIRTQAGADRSMDLLEHAVQSAESFMAEALPTNFIGLLFEDALSSSAAGTNFRTHVAIWPRYDADDDSHDADQTASIIAHEVAHYYWRGSADWIDEGAADFMASVIEHEWSGTPIEPNKNPCPYFDDITELEELNPSHGDDEFICNYALGGRLFLDLHRSLPVDVFTDGFRGLYAVSESARDSVGWQDAALGIEDVRDAFSAGGSRAEIVIRRWYDGTESYDLSFLDDDRPRRNIPGLDGHVEHLFVSADTNGSRARTFVARQLDDWLVLNVEYSYTLSGRDRTVDITIVEHYEDGFVFRRQSTELTAESRYIGATWYYYVGVSPDRAWRPGRYGVTVYVGGRKLAEVSYVVKA